MNEPLKSGKFSISQLATNWFFVLQPIDGELIRMYS